MDRLIAEYRRLDRNHHAAIIARAARIVAGPSVTRVYRAGTKADILAALTKIPVAELRRIRGEQQYRRWFGRRLNAVTKAIGKRNRCNRRVNPGLQWGHATKVLCLFVAHLVQETRFFTDSEVRRLQPLLYVPIDSVVMAGLREVGVTVPFQRIREIETAQMFYDVQDRLGAAAAAAKCPRIWFDDRWATRP